MVTPHGHRLGGLVVANGPSRAGRKGNAHSKRRSPDGRPPRRPPCSVAAGDAPGMSRPSASTPSRGPAVRRCLGQLLERQRRPLPRRSGPSRSGPPLGRDDVRPVTALAGSSGARSRPASPTTRRAGPRRRRRDPRHQAGDGPKVKPRPWRTGSGSIARGGAARTRPLGPLAAADRGGPCSGSSGWCRRSRRRAASCSTAHLHGPL